MQTVASFLGYPCQSVWLSVRVSPPLASLSTLASPPLLSRFVSIPYRGMYALPIGHTAIAFVAIIVAVLSHLSAAAALQTCGITSNSTTFQECAACRGGAGVTNVSSRTWPFASPCYPFASLRTAVTGRYSSFLGRLFRFNGIQPPELYAEPVLHTR